MAAPQNVLALVENFDRHIEDYRRGRKGETEIRVEFIDPFFEALGWDVNNRSGYAEAYKDVVHEDAIKVGGTTKAPDYCFRVGGTRKFFLEAKKPSVDIAKDIGPAYQLRRYAWSAKLPLSILTDFEEFAVYDCRVRPAKTDKASKARVQYLTYTDYAEHWDELAGTFSKQAVLQGSFDKYVHDKKRKKGTAEVDEEFLKEIERWRDHLARNIALRNPHLGVRDVNFAVQRTIDRIIFLRMCEDRGVEAYGRLQGLINGERVYPRLLEFFRAADDRYNSGLFHFNDERDRATSPDTLTPDLDIDDKVLKDIFKNLYYPDSPYEFGVLPADILGNVYEQFLGKVIRLTPAGQAKVEEKPEVKKAGGVYYTPKYIVDYIVKHTVGELIDGKTPIEIGGLTDSWKPSTAKNRRPLTVCDPACGSGSFLIGAYRYLLNYHRDWYVNDGPENHTERIYQGAGGQWYLATEEKKRILLACIYGVDIDPQAVEVTKLNLLLAVLENENQQTLGQLNLIHQRVLPDLGNNIKCGNSLIASDFYNGQQLDLFDEEAQYKINAFDWPDEFPHILGQDLQQKQRGFNAVIGNPPYVLLQDDFRQENELEYFRSKYMAARYKLDTYHLFMEKATTLVEQSGRNAFITPANFLTNNYLAKLRRLLVSRGSKLRILIIDGGVFKGISVDNAIYVLSTGSGPASIVMRHATVQKAQLDFGKEAHFEGKQVLADDNALLQGGHQEMAYTPNAASTIELGTIADVNFGKQLRNRKVYTEDVIELKSDRIPPGYRACVTGKDISRYNLKWNRLACLESDEARRGGCWDASKHDAHNKLLTRQIGRFPEFALDETGYQVLNTAFMVNIRPERNIDAICLLGILNSRFCRHFWLSHYYDQRRTFPKIKGSYLKKLPLPKAILQGERTQGLVIMVDRMLSFHKQLGAANTEHGRVMLERQIRATDREIDALVYELYGLSDDEISIVEAATE